MTHELERKIQVGTFVPRVDDVYLNKTCILTP